MKRIRELCEKRIIIGVLIAVTAAIGSIILYENKASDYKYERVMVSIAEDNEFDNGSKIEIENLTEIQEKTLFKLCKIWGFVKYYHPEVAKGKLNWDYDLFRVMPKVLELDDDKKIDKVIYGWIDSIGIIEEGTFLEKENEEVMLEPDTEWIKDSNFISSELSKLLLRIQSSKKAKTNYYVMLNNGKSIFQNEKDYSSMNYKDDGYKLLSLFRYWNIIEYFFPYRSIMDENWNLVLTQFIPKMIQCNDKLTYNTVICELIGEIQDGHANMNLKVFRKVLGENVAPLNVKLIENNVVVVKKLKELSDDSNIEIGDIILKINDRDVNEVIEERAKYKPQSNKAFHRPWLMYLLLRSNYDYLDLLIKRDNTLIKERIKCSKDLSIIRWEEKSEVSHKIIGDNIGYIYPGILAKNEIDTIMEKFKDTKGLIVDLRCYPSEYIGDSLGKYIMKKPTEFAKITVPTLNNPGQFIAIPNLKVGVYNHDYYKGKVIIIINEEAQSKPEFTAMALRVAPNATVIGSNSHGADGDVSYIVLPGNITTRISGVGVYYPDGSETQRIGIIPDIEVKPTIEGIKSGRDELLEKAIELIND